MLTPNLFLYRIQTSDSAVFAASGRGVVDVVARGWCPLSLPMISMAAVFFDVVLVTGLEVEVVVDVFAPDHCGCSQVIDKPRSVGGLVGVGWGGVGCVGGLIGHFQMFYMHLSYIERAASNFLHAFVVH